MFHVKEYLTPKDLSEKGLAPVLDAMEVRDFSVPSPVTKKRLLRILWRDIPFEACFGKYIQKRGVAFGFLINCYMIAFSPLCFWHCRFGIRKRHFACKNTVAAIIQSCLKDVWGIIVRLVWTWKMAITVQHIFLFKLMTWREIWKFLFSSTEDTEYCICNHWDPQNSHILSS